MMRKFMSLLIGLLMAMTIMVDPAEAVFLLRSSNALTDDLVYDTNTGLLWDRCTWRADCLNSNGGTTPTTLTWEAALKAARTANTDKYKGFDDWRLPSIKELLSLVDFTKNSPAIDAAIFPSTQFQGDPNKIGYWSSTNLKFGEKISENPLVYSTNTNNILGIRFLYGSYEQYLRTALNYVRLVRSNDSGVADDEGQIFANYDKLSVKPVTSTVTITPKAFDTTTTATIATCTLSPVVAGLSCDFSGATATFNTAEVGENKPVTVSGLKLAGAAASNYVLTNSSLTAQGTITAVPVTSTVTITPKAFDTTTTATIATCTLSPVVAGLSCDFSGATATFNTAEVGENKPVTVSGLKLAGAAASNYVLTNSSLTAQGTITAVPVTATATVNDKTWDGNDAATLQSCVLNGVISGDQVSCVVTNAHFNTPDVDDNKPVTAEITLQGANASNYEISNATIEARANIIELPDCPAKQASKEQEFSTEKKGYFKACAENRLQPNGTEAELVNCKTAIKSTIMLGATGYPDRTLGCKTDVKPDGSYKSQSDIADELAANYDAIDVPLYLKSDSVQDQPGFKGILARLRAMNSVIRKQLSECLKDPANYNGQILRQRLGGNDGVHGLNRYNGKSLGIGVTVIRDNLFSACGKP